MTAPRMFAFAAALALSAAIAIAPHAALALGSTPVTVTNPSVPVTVGNPDDPAAFAKAQGIQHPFQIGFSCKTPVVTFACSADFDLSTYEPNRRLIIEYIDGNCTIAAGANLVLIQMDTVVAAATVSHLLPILDHVGAPSPFDSGATSIVSFGQPVRIYADASTFINLIIAVSGGPVPNCTFNLSGQTIDVP